MVAALAFIAWGTGCGGRTLVAVDPCGDGSAGTCPSAGDASAESTLRNGLIGLWHLDESAGSSMVVDSSGNENHGMLVDLDPSLAWVAGHLTGNALAVEGAGYVLVPFSPSIDRIVSGVTVSAWVYYDGTIVDYGTALSRQIGTSFGQYYHLSLWQAEGDPSLFITKDLATSPTQLIASAVAPRAVWTHLAGTYDGTTAILYVDGRQAAIASVSGQFVADTSDLILGGNRNGQSVTESFPGRIDEVALYDRALTAEEISGLFTGKPF